MPSSKFQESIREQGEPMKGLHLGLCQREKTYKQVRYGVRGKMVSATNLMR